MKSKSTLHTFLLAAGSSLIAISSASAASGTWDTDLAGDWTDITKWLGDADYASGADSTATFGNFITADRIINLNTGITIGNITASDASNNYTISGANILTLDRTDSIAPIIDVTTSGRTLTISSEIAGLDGLTKIGAGTLVLSRASAANTYSGTTTLSAGILEGNTGASTSLTPGNPFGTSVLQLNGGTLRLRSSGASNGTAETIQWNNNTTVGGNVTINVERAGGSGSNKIHQLGTLSIGAYTLIAEDASNAQHDLSFGATTLTGNAVFDVRNNGGGSTFMNLTLGAVGGSGYSLTKSGAGTLTLSGASTYSGGTTMSAGKISVTNNSGFGSGTITVTGNSTIEPGYNAFSQIANALQVDATKTLTAGGSTQFYGITFSGVVSGSGTISTVGGNNASTRNSLGLTNASNTFTGTLVNPGGSAIINVNSLGDAGKIQLSGNNVTGGFAFGAGSATSLLFNTRQIELAGSSALYNNNDTGKTFTVNTNLAFSGTGVRTLTLGGSNTGANAFAGIIGNNGASAVSLTKESAGSWALTNSANSYTGATTVTGGVLNVSTLTDGGSNSSIGASTNAAGSLILNGGTLRYTGAAVSTDRLFSLQTSSSINSSGTGAINFTNTGAMGFNGNTAAKTLTLTGTNTGNNTIAAVIGNNTAATAITKTGIGTWVLSAINTNTGNTSISGGGKLILDYGTTDDNKIAGVLSLGGGEITLKGGSFLDTVTSTTIATGAHTSITRDGGTAKIAFGAITKAAENGGTMSLAEDSLATTTSTVTNGILGGGITVGSNWAKVDGSGNIIALTAGDYTALPTGTTTATVNYQLTGSQTRAATATVNSLRISGDGNDQILTFTSGDLRPSALGSGPAGNTGGILYAGGGNNNYTITGAGNVFAQNNNRELIINTFQGALTLDMAITTGSAAAGLTKAGVGTLILTKAGTYTGATYVNQGALRLRHATGAGTTAGGIFVQNNATLELANSVAIGAEALTITGNGSGSNTGALRNIASNTSSYAGVITIGTGGARINSDASGALTLTNGVVTSPFNNVTFGGAGNITVSTAAISGAGGLVKDGAGTTTLSATNSYTGATTVNNGKLIVNGSISTSTLTTVQTGATLGGTGTIGHLTIDSGGTFSPGNSPGIETVNGNYIQNGTLVIETEGLLAGNGLGFHDQVIVNGAVTLNGLLDLTAFFGTYVENDLIFILLNDGVDAVNGIFTNSGYTQGANIGTFAGREWLISYNADSLSNTFTGTLNGNDIALIAIPEPNVAALLGGLGALMILRRRR